VRQSLSLSRGLSSWTTWTTGLFAFFFIFSALWVAEFFALPFRRAQDQGRELAGATELRTRPRGFEGGRLRSRLGERVFLDSFRLRPSLADHPESTSFVDTSAFVGTNADELKKNLIRAEGREGMQCGLARDCECTGLSGQCWSTL
jgi:hypothetical protein